MSLKSSINRPPTPDGDEDDGDRREAPSLQEAVNLKLIESGEKERLKELLRERLAECGWRDELRAQCRAFVRQRGRESLTVDDLVRAITPKGRALVPNDVKAELLRQIKTFLTSN